MALFFMETARMDEVHLRSQQYSMRHPELVSGSVSGFVTGHFPNPEGLYVYRTINDD